MRRPFLVIVHPVIPSDMPYTEGIRRRLFSHRPLLGEEQMNWQGDSSRPNSPNGPDRERPQSWKKPRQESAAGGTRRWTESTGSASSGRQFQRFARLFIYLVVLVLLTGLLVRFLLFRPVSVPLIAAAVTGYQLPVPPNSLAADDVVGITEMAKGYANIDVRDPPTPIDNQTQLLGWLQSQIKKARPGGPDKNAVIVYLSAHGLVNDRGEPSLLLPNQNPIDGQTWLTVDTLLDRIVESRRPGTRTLLILDAGHLDVQWSMGVLYNSFADRLVQLVEQRKIPGLWVLNSAGPGQSGRLVPEWGGSLFGHFVTLGLRGAADRGESKDDQVSLTELVEYVRQETSNWCRNNGGSIQEPFITPQLPAEKDVGLAFVSGDIELSFPKIDATVETEQLDGLWRRHAQLRDRRPYQEDPLAWAELEARLLRLESLRWAGSAYRTQATATIDRIDGLCTRLEHDPTSFRLKTPSLARISRAARSTTQELVAAKKRLGRWLAEQEEEARTAAQPDEPKADAEDDKKKDVDGSNKSPDGANSNQTDGPTESSATKQPAEPLPPPLPFHVAADVVHRWWVQQPTGITATELEQGFAFLSESDRSAVTATVETHLADMLLRHLDWSQSAVQQRVKTALIVRRLTERVAVPDDERVIYWARNLLQPVDGRVRLAEDRLFIANSTALAEADDDWVALAGSNLQGGQLKQALSIEAELTQAFVVRDQTWALLPWLAQWVLGQSRWNPNDEWIDQLQTLITTTHELGAALDDLPIVSSQPVKLDAIVRLRKEVEQGLNRLLNAIADRARFFLDLQAGKVRQHLPELQLLLRTALITGRQRAELRSLATQKTTVRANTTSDGGSDPVSAADDTKFVLRLAGRIEHPALKILDRKALKTDAEGTVEDGPSSPQAGRLPPGSAGRTVALDRLLDWEKNLRQRLAEIPKKRSELAAESSRLLEGAQEQPPATVRLPVSRADRMVRAAAVFLGGRPWSSSEEDPARVLADIDRFFAMLWQAERRLDDFWGPPATGSEPFFVTSTRELLDRAAASPLSGRAFRAPMEAFLDQRKALAAQGLPLTAPPLWQTPGEQDAEHEIVVGDTPEWPAGRAAIFVKRPGAGGEPVAWQDVNHRPLGRRGSNVGQASALTRLKHLFPVTEETKELVYLDAVALFRGQLTPRPFMVGGDVQGDVVAYDRPDPGPTTVRVKGKARQVTQLLLILDCSSSMTAKMQFENKEPTRFAVARDRINTIIKRLPPENYEIGLMLYGNRAGWSETSNEIVWRNPQDKGLHPGADVQLVQPIKRMIYRDSAGKVVDHREEIAEVLESAGPWGETPLYYALTLAIDAFDREKQSPCSIIVVTDGIDEQSTDAPNPTHRVDVEQLLADPRYSGTRIDIVEFGRSATDKQQDAKKRGDLKAIARNPNSGGDFHEAEDPSSLLQKLEASIERVKFYVAPELASSRAAGQAIDLGSSWTMQPNQKTQQYTIQLVGARQPVGEQIELQGGEALELEYDRPAQRLEHRRYEDALREAAENLVDPLKSERRLFIATHKATRQGNQVTMFVSVQNQTAHRFSRRPRHAWCEVRPSMSNSSAHQPVYVFYDLSFVPNRPVPVLQLQVPQWPANVETATVQMWLHMDDDVQANHVVDITSLETTTHRYPDLPEMSFRIEPRPGTNDEPYRIVVIEEHQPNTDLVNVRLLAQPPADRIVHSFISAANQVRHVFVYNDRTVIARQTPQISITSEERLKKNAVFTRPLEITIPRQ